MENAREEHDTLGDVKVPEKAYYGAQTVRAINNFPISGLKPGSAYVSSTVIIKKAAAILNHHLGYEKTAEVVNFGLCKICP